MILFPNGVQGLADSKWQGTRGQVEQLVGVDYRSEPGLIKANQKLTKISAETVNELCKVSLPVSDGSTLWFSSESGKIWREVDEVFTLLGEIVGFPAWGIQYSIFSGNQFDYSAQINIATATQFKPDGTVMYVMGDGDTPGLGKVFQYTLSTAWDVSTASYASKTYTTDPQAMGMFISPDGARLFITEDGGTTSVIEYTLSTAWDISTASASGKTYSFSAQGSRGVGISFKSDGTKMFILQQTTQRIDEYTLSTAWDVSTASYVANFTITGSLHFSGGFFMSPDGQFMFIMRPEEEGVLQKIELSTPWDISTASLGEEYVIGGDRRDGLAFSPDGRNFYVSNRASLEIVFQYVILDEGDNVIVLSAEEYAVPDEDDEMVPYIYFTIKNWLLQVAVSNIVNIATNGEFKNLAEFINGDETYHPMKKQNGRLYIGDKYVIAEVNEFGVVTLQTELNVPRTERITTVTAMDTDLLIGTKDIDRCWVRRWDTESDSWFAQDDIFETEIYAFIHDDNYVYVQAGDYGQLYFYDGEKLLPHTRIPGNYSPTNRSKVNQNAVGFLLGIPVFGVSNIEGNPVMQGVYSYGRYSKDYNITLDLSFPISVGVFSDIEIGSIVVQGFNLYVSYKTEYGAGVDKLDWSAKYESAYIQTTVLNAPKDRAKFKSIDSISADYYELPTDTSIEFSVNNNYQGFNDIETQQKVDEKLHQVRAKSTQRELGAVQVLIEFNVNGNETPKLENIDVNFVGEK